MQLKWLVLFVWILYEFHANAQHTVYPLYLAFVTEIDTPLIQSTYETLSTPDCPVVTNAIVKFSEIKPNDFPADLNTSSGIFGSTEFVWRQKNIRGSSAILGSCKADDIYVTTLGVSPMGLLKAGIELLKSYGDFTSKTVIAMPKYMMLPFIKEIQNLGGSELLFWYQQPTDSRVLCKLINDAEVINIVVVLPTTEDVNNVVQEAYDLNLFTWNRRWILVSLEGEIPTFAKPRTFASQNVSVISVGRNFNDQPLSRQLARDTAKVAKAFLQHKCCPNLQTTPIKGETGDFDMNNSNGPRITTQLTVSRGLMTPPNIVGCITIDEVSHHISVNVLPLGDFNDSVSEIVDILQSRPIRIAISLAPPFTMLAKGVPAPASNAPQKYEINQLTGLSIDLIRELLDPQKCMYEAYVYPTNSTVGTANILEAVAKGKADIAVGALALLQPLKEKFDFVTNFLYFTFAILQKPFKESEADYLWLFFHPLTPGSWVFVVFCSFFAAVVMATLNYFSPNNVNYGLNESIFVTFGCLFQGLTVSPPNTWSSRIMQCVWWLFVLFFIVIYIANYAALKMSNGLIGEASGFHALLVDPSVPFGALPNSMADFQLATSTDTKIEQINYLSNHLYPQKPEDIITIESRVQEVVQGKYRLIADSYTLEYFARQYCLEVHGELASEQYALLLRRGTVYTDYLNFRLIELSSTGKLQSIIDKYITGSNSGSCRLALPGTDSDGTSRTAITLAEVGGMFILMAIGTAVAVILAVIECLFARKLAPLANRMIKTETRAKLRNFL